MAEEYAAAILIYRKLVLAMLAFVLELHPSGGKVIDLYHCGEFSDAEICYNDTFTHLFDRYCGELLIKNNP